LYANFFAKTFEMHRKDVLLYKRSCEKGTAVSYIPTGPQLVTSTSARLEDLYSSKKWFYHSRSKHSKYWMLLA